MYLLQVANEQLTNTTIPHAAPVASGFSLALGFFFALGHSSVVVVAATAIALTAGGVQSHFPALIESGSAVGTAKPK